jgi:hypothetical protein
MEFELRLRRLEVFLNQGEKSEERDIAAELAMLDEQRTKLTQSSKEFAELQKTFQDTCTFFSFILFFSSEMPPASQPTHFLATRNVFTRCHERY